MLGQVLVNGLSLSATYVIIALGLSLIMGIMDILNFTHGVMIMLGAFGLYVLHELFHIHYILSALIAILLVGALGAAMERKILHKIRRDHLICLLITIGLATVVEGSFLLCFGTRDRGVTSITPGLLRIWGITVTYDRMVIIVAAALLVGGLWFFMQWSKPGRAMRAVTQNTDAALSLGIDVDHMTSLAMFIGCAFAATAGVLMAPITVLNPYMGFGPLLKAFVVIVLGGLGSIPGSILGGFVLGMVDSIAGSYLHIEIASIVGFVLMMLILIIKPSGLMGKRL
jgi:branched-chain amino acid transport system permease protein